MKVLCINSSPRPKGNTRYLMDLVIQEMDTQGQEARLLDATKLDVKRCIGCGTCEKTGHCVFKDDDYTKIVLPALIEADLLVVAAPIYFYAFPADIKALIDRTQVLWSRKYRLKTGEFDNRERNGVLLGVAATGGKGLFAGMEQTARYFFDAAGMNYKDALLYRGLDEKGEMAAHPTVLDDVKKLVTGLLGE